MNINNEEQTARGKNIAVRTAFSLITMNYQKMAGQADFNLLKNYYASISTDESLEEEMGGNVYYKVMDALALLIGTGIDVVARKSNMTVEQFYSSIDNQFFYDDEELKTAVKLLLFNGKNYYSYEEYINRDFRKDFYEIFNKEPEVQLQLVNILCYINLYMLTTLSIISQVHIEKIIEDFAHKLALL